jgi:hypothetical protein
MLAVLALALFVGERACGWALRQSGDSWVQRESRRVRRRRQQTSPVWELVAIDRASVWRSTSLRRGLLVLAVLPGIIAAVAGLQWPSLVLLPGLVAAGAGLLFGVNAFCLDASGSVWLASLPGHARHAFVAKTLVVFEVCAIAVAITMIAGVARAGGPPTTAAITALCCCAAVTILRVVALCMRLSVERPHRADLRGARDTPAPPGVMAVYSARLALSTTVVALLFSGLARVPDWRFSVLLALPLVLLSVRRLVQTSRAWADPAVRARVVAVVSAG